MFLYHIINQRGGELIFSDALKIHIKPSLASQKITALFFKKSSPKNKD